MTDQIKKYNEIIELGESTYLDMQKTAPNLLEDVTEAFKFIAQAVDASRKYDGAYLSALDARNPDKWQIGFCAHLVGKGFLALHNFMTETGKCDPEADISEAAQLLPDDLKGEFVASLSDATLKLLEKDGVLDPTILSIAATASTVICDKLDAHEAAFEYKMARLKANVSKGRMKEINKQLGFAKKVAKQTQKGFKNN